MRVMWPLTRRRINVHSELNTDSTDVYTTALYPLQTLMSPLTSITGSTTLDKSNAAFHGRVQQIFVHSSAVTAVAQEVKHVRNENANEQKHSFTANNTARKPMTFWYFSEQ